MQLKFQKKTSLLRPKCCLHQHFKHGRLLVVGDGSGGREEGGGEGHGILPMSASSHKGAGVAEKISNIIRGSLKKYLRKKIKIPNYPPPPSTHKL